MIFARMMRRIIWCNNINFTAL